MHQEAPGFEILFFSQEVKYLLDGIRPGSPRIIFRVDLISL